MHLFTHKNECAHNTPQVALFSQHILLVAIFLFTALIPLSTFAQTTPSPQACPAYTQRLYQGISSSYVQTLQTILNQSSDTRVAETGPGSLGSETIYFGPATRQAVIRFQEKYRNDILVPVGLVSGTGIVGPSTWAHLLRVCMAGISGTPPQSAASVTSVAPASATSITAVTVTNGPVRIRQIPTTGGQIISVATNGMTGTQIGNPITFDGYTWRKVQYESGVTGWSITDALTVRNTIGTSPAPSTTTNTSTGVTSTGGSGGSDATRSTETTSKSGGSSGSSGSGSGGGSSGGGSSSGGTGSGGGSTGATSTPTTNTSPTISGTPSTSGTVGKAYTFTPTAADANGDTLTFSITNKPSWATFNTATGKLSGTPSSAGTFSNITIAVTDGKSAGVALAPFSIVVKAPTTTTPPSTTRRYNPGHYVSVEIGDNTVTKLTKNLPSIDQPGVVGVQMRYTWAELEPTKGQYDFSKIREHISLLQARGLKLIIFPQDKGFQTTASVVPAYLQSDPACPSTSPCVVMSDGQAPGPVAVRWHPEVRTRWKALISALGTEFDTNTTVEGIAFQESAIGITSVTSTTLTAYTPEKYRDTLIDMLKHAAITFPHSQIFWFMNYLQGHQSYLADIASAVAPYGVSMGGPDVRPDNESLVRMTYPYFDMFKNKMTLFNSMQFESHKEECSDTSRAAGLCSGTFWTMEELMVWARDNLHVRYVIWNHVRSATEGYTWADDIPVIAKYSPTFYPVAGTTNIAPTISGIPRATAGTGVGYTFIPIAADANGDMLTFSITNKPSWTVFDTKTGNLSGTPSSSNVGVTSPITISVSDGRASASLSPFTISVLAPSDIDTTPPSGVTKLTAASAANSVTLTWSAATDNVGVTGHTIYRNSLKVGTTQGIGYTDTGLTPLTAYMYAVTAFDAEGNESSKVYKRATTTAALP